VTLFLRLVNESAHKCRELVTAVLRSLIQKSSKRFADVVWQMQTGSSGAEGASESLLNGKVQLLSLMADCGKLAKSDVQKAVELIAGVVRAAGESALVYSMKQSKILEKKAAEYSDDDA
jgi:hypothetical protein